MSVINTSDFLHEGDNNHMHIRGLWGQSFHLCAPNRLSNVFGIKHVHTKSMRPKSNHSSPACLRGRPTSAANSLTTSIIRSSRHQVFQPYSSHRHLPCLDGERDRGRNSQSEEAALWEHAGVEPTSHDTEALWERAAMRCRRHSDVGIMRRIQTSLKVETLRSHVSGGCQTRHHDSVLTKRILICPWRTLFILMRNYFPVAAGIFHLTKSSHWGCECSRGQNWTHHSHKCTVGLHSVCTCYLSHPYLCAFLFLSLYCWKFDYLIYHSGFYPN